MKELAIVSDSHIPSRAASYPEWALEHVRSADITLHAGDHDSSSALDTIAETAGEGFVTVRGNMDPGRLDLAPVETIDVEDITVVLTHNTGQAEGYEERLFETARHHADGLAIAIGGHTHECLDEQRGDIRLLNPGSVTAASPATEATMYVATVDGSDVTVLKHRG